MNETEIAGGTHVTPPLRRDERGKQIVVEPPPRPCVRIGETARRFRVSAETGRGDVEALSPAGLVWRCHGGSTARVPCRYPGHGERTRAHEAERERVARRAAGLVRPGGTGMVDRAPPPCKSLGFSPPAPRPAPVSPKPSASR